MFLLLLGAAALYLMFGGLGEGLFLLAGALVSIGLVIFQEARSERALAALNALAEPIVRVIRGGEQKLDAGDRAGSGRLVRRRAREAACRPMRCWSAATRSASTNSR